MGNCIHVLLHPSEEKSRVLLYNGGEQEFKASTLVKKIISGRYLGYKLVHHALPFARLPPNSKLDPGEVYYVIPPLAKHCSQVNTSKLANREPCRKKKIKIVLTRQQLELLLGNAEELKSKGIAVWFSQSFVEESRKWQPCLVAIPEV